MDENKIKYLLLSSAKSLQISDIIGPLSTYLIVHVKKSSDNCF